MRAEADGGLADAQRDRLRGHVFPAAGGSFTPAALRACDAADLRRRRSADAALTAAPPAAKRVTRAAFVDRLRASLDCIAFMRLLCSAVRGRSLLFAAIVPLALAALFVPHRLSRSGGIANRRCGTRDVRCLHHLPASAHAKVLPTTTRLKKRAAGKRRPARSTTLPPISADGNRTDRRRAFARRASRRPARAPR